MNGSQIKRILASLVVLGSMWGAQSAQSAAIVFNDEAAFRAAAGAVTTYSFETHGVVESTHLASPVSAVQLDNSFNIGYTGLNLFEIVDAAADPGAVDGTHFLFTHSQATSPTYSLTFSNFGSVNALVTAFGLTVVDFASNIQNPTEITYDTGALSGTLLSVPGGQPDFTQNFVGLIVDPSEAFNSITLVLNDVNSGFQSFDEVIFSRAAAIPNPSTLLLLCLGGLALALQRRASTHQ
jgi:hypothetical protein